MWQSESIVEYSCFLSFPPLPPLYVYVDSNEEKMKFVQQNISWCASFSIAMFKCNGVDTFKCNYKVGKVCANYDVPVIRLQLMISKCTHATKPNKRIESKEEASDTILVSKMPLSGEFKIFSKNLHGILNENKQVFFSFSAPYSSSFSCLFVIIADSIAFVHVLTSLNLFFFCVRGVFLFRKCHTHKHT